MARRGTRTARWWPLLFLPALGCGPGGPVRYDVSGTVTFGGQPVPAGWVVFTADTTKSNSGPQGVARIRSGRFSTADKDGKGTVGGPVVVRIEGFDGQGTEAALDGRRIFAPYEIRVELPRSRPTQDFDVPAAWASQEMPAPPS